MAARQPGHECVTKCHVLSCDVMFAMPSPMLCRSVPAYRPSIAFRPPPFRPPRRRLAGRDPLPRAFACGRGRVSAPARFARLIARARGSRRVRRFHRPLPAGVAECHAMSCLPCLRRCFAVPFVHIVPPSRSVLLRSVRPAAARRAGPCFARNRARAQARVGAGAVRAPDRPRASQAQGAPLLSVPAGAFFAAPATLLRRKAERRPRKPPFIPILAHFLTDQVSFEQKMNMKHFLVIMANASQIRLTRGRFMIPC